MGGTGGVTAPVSAVERLGGAGGSANITPPPTTNDTSGDAGETSPPPPPFSPSTLPPVAGPAARDGSSPPPPPFSPSTLPPVAGPAARDGSAELEPDHDPERDEQSAFYSVADFGPDFDDSHFAIGDCPTGTAPSPRPTGPASPTPVAVSGGQAVPQPQPAPGLFSSMRSGLAGFVRSKVVAAASNSDSDRVNYFLEKTFELGVGSTPEMRARARRTAAAQLQEACREAEVEIDLNKADPGRAGRRFWGASNGRRGRGRSAQHRPHPLTAQSAGAGGVAKGGGKGGGAARNRSASAPPAGRGRVAGGAAGGKDEEPIGSPASLKLKQALILARRFEATDLEEYKKAVLL